MEKDWETYNVTNHQNSLISNWGEIYFEGEIVVNVTLENKTKKLKIFELKNINNLFSSDAIQEFELWDAPINAFCNKKS